MQINAILLQGLQNIQCVCVCGSRQLIILILLMRLKNIYKLILVYLWRNI